jgi:TetR/AcrR family transcriptional repressor of nem operon
MYYSPVVALLGEVMTPVKNPELTRQHILEMAMKKVHQTGFQAASLNDILEDTGVTKGALYHHFPNKNALGYALVDEVVRGYIHKSWKNLQEAENPIDAILECMQKQMEKEGKKALECGCPLNNLAQEMSTQDEKFRKLLNDVYQEWIDYLAAAFEKGKANKTIRADVDAKASAAFFVSTIEGMAGLAKTTHSVETMQAVMGQLVQYLNNLRFKD